MLTLSNPQALFWNAIFGSGRTSTSRAINGLRRNNDVQGQQTTVNGVELAAPIEELFKTWESSPIGINPFSSTIAPPMAKSELSPLEQLVSSTTNLRPIENAPNFLENFRGLEKELRNVTVSPVSRRKGVWRFGIRGTNFSFLAADGGNRGGKSNDVIYIQTRGFRTRAAIGVGQERPSTGGSGRTGAASVAEEKQSIGNIFSFMNKSPEIDRSAQVPLTRLLNEASTETNKKNLKDAFAEGYQTGAERNVKKKATPWLLFLRVSFLVVLLYVFWPVIAELFGSGVSGRSTLFKTMHTEVNPEDVKVTFNDVKAIDEAKAEVKQIVEYLKDPERFCRLGARLPKGVLLVGPPGTGKTLLARAIAGEAGVPFFRAAGSEFEEMLVGQGARRVRELFGAARQRAPCVVFIDEIDSCGSRRTSSALHPYANQMINQLLTEMDGFEPNEGVIVLAATNRRDDLDPALMRPGRFDVEVHVSNPDLKGRQDILKLYMSKIVAGKDVDIDLLARRTVGFSGADLESMVNQAALKAATDNKDEVSMPYFEAARHFVIAGPAKTRIPDEQTNELTAYHEAGHALVAFFTPDSVHLDRATIIPRAGSLGHTSFVPEKEQYNQTKGELLAALDSLMGGRAAEELIYGNFKVTTGASSDLMKATEIATNMVKHSGMSEKVGLRTFDNRRNDVLVVVNDISPGTSEMIDGEIKRLLSESYERAVAILKTHSKAHKRLAEALLQYETLDFKEMKAIIEGEPFSGNTP